MLGRERGPGLLVGVGGDHDLGEDRGDLAPRPAVERPVAGDDAAEGAERVAGQRLAVGLGEVGADGDAAGVGVLDDHDRGLGELGHQRQRPRRRR